MSKHFFCTLLCFFVGCTFIFAQSQRLSDKYINYIKKYHPLAQQQQKMHGIPASITLAQGLLESQCGESRLAKVGNNHFGIKCNGWTGDTILKDDDKINDCFRRYARAEDSFSDHSAFLKRKRYAPLFNLKKDDYAAWARTLKKCGYATDPQYPQKLIKLIQDYHLDRLTDKNWETVCNTGTNPSTNRPVVVKRNEPIAIITSNPEPEYVEPLTAREEKKLFLLTHKKQRCNGVRYVIAKEGDTYASVAFCLNIRERDLREYNDALGRTLQPGDRIYLAKKKTQAPKEKTLMWVTPGETLWEVCQREGVQLKKVQQYNNFDPSIRILKTRQAIYLRKPKKEK